MSKIKSNIFFIIGALLFLISFSASSQNSNLPLAKDCNQKDIRDIFGQNNRIRKPSNKAMLLVLPKLATNPVNGVLLGLSGAMVWRFGPEETTRVSMLNGTVARSTKSNLFPS